MQRTLQEETTAFERILANSQSFGVGLSEFIALGDWRLFFYTRDQLQKVKAKDVDRAATRYFVATTVSLATTFPKIARSGRDPGSSASGRAACGVPALGAGQSAEAFEPTQENIDQRTRILTLVN